MPLSNKAAIAVTLFALAILPLKRYCAGGTVDPHLLQLVCDYHGVEVHSPYIAW
jgi:hypothetical protein